MPHRPIPLAPTFHPTDPEGERASQALFARWAARLAAEACGPASAASPTEPLRVLRALALSDASSVLGGYAQPVRLALSALCDLAAHGWQIRVDGDPARVYLCRPEPEGGASQGPDGRAAEKERVRRALRIAREEQLAEPSVRAFVSSMETRRDGPRGWSSVHQLLRDGPELADRLAEIGERPTDGEVRAVVAPYLQFVSEDDRCAWTGLRLADVWRYFRYTWLNPARSTPGRQMMILVRDASCEPHPVIGIAALSSAIVQQSARDAAIGWDADGTAARLRAHPTDADAGWLLASLDACLSGIRSDDLVDGAELAEPTEETVARLRAICAAARARHQTQARNSGMRRHQAEVRWESIVDTPLYRSKRAGALADLLSVRAAFHAAGLTEPSEDQLRAAFAGPGGTAFRRAVGRLVRQVKASRVGINMMDVSVAGALPPYNALLGGKLVSMLLASPEVRLAYRRRYAGAPSVIASGMRGAPVVRDPELVLLCTTGLFGGGSSQYNRVRIPAAKVGAPGTGQVRYARLPQDTHFTTFHISQATLAEMKRYAEQWHDGSAVNNLFGEGVNPKMRRIREGLGRVGLPAEAILQAGSPRSVYIIPLAHNFQDVLLGKSARPDYILGVPEGEEACQVTEGIAAFWRERWLVPRIRSAAVLEAVRAHVLTFPIRHGGVVALPPVPEEEGTALPPDEYSLFDVC